MFPARTSNKLSGILKNTVLHPEGRACWLYPQDRYMMRDPIPKRIAWLLSIRNSIKEVVRLGKKAPRKPLGFVQEKWMFRS